MAQVDHQPIYDIIGRAFKEFILDNLELFKTMDNKSVVNVHRPFNKKDLEEPWAMKNAAPMIGKYHVQYVGKSYYSDEEVEFTFLDSQFDKIYTLTLMMN